MSEKSNQNEVVPTACGNSQLADPKLDDVFVKPHYTTRKAGDEAWEIGVVVPGVKRKDVSVSLEDGELEVVARRYDELPEGWRPLNDRGPRPNYRLRLELAVDVEEDRVSAKLEDGILTLRLPVAEAAKPKSISVE